MKEVKAFIGREAEGPDYGDFTLFIPRTVTQPWFSLYKTLHRERITRIYFGAGNKKGITKKQVTFIETLLEEGLVVLLEVDKATYSCLRFFNPVTLSKIQTIFVVDIPLDHAVPFNHVKFVSRQDLFWLQVKKAFRTPLNHPFYNLDKPCE